MLKSIKFDGSSLHYAVLGEGPPLVFLHGFLGNLSVWKSSARHFSTSHKLILIDLPGHGRSELSQDIETMAYMARKVAAVCDYEQVSNPIVIGHSMGGYVGLELAKILKIRLVLLHSNFWADAEQKKIDRDRVVEIVKNDLPLFLRTLIPNLFSPSNRKRCESMISELTKLAKKMDPFCIASTTKGMRDRLNNTAVLNTTSVVIIQGTEDSIIPKVKMQTELKLVKKLPDYYEIDNSGHMGFLEQPEKFLELMTIIIRKFALLNAIN